ncbi:hypothetical protein [Spirosoma linguale]|uniref:Uncharacterized protein n=1 Tax=Spirosoma linguale (strain ATCC 33905 / DSM 74 / LMG 10896 / Claus 1) TaxID=504472 RepID=D2QJJ5_SPILD|nr:hypothetical protein Slin_4053 [Spirosoma linguale DSM 74]
MGHQSSYKDPNAVKSKEIESILSEWIAAMVDFRTHYKMLAICAERKSKEQIQTLSGHLYIGQCPISELKSLMSTMKAELEKLLQHVDQVSEIGQNSSTMDYTTIIGHTSVLKQLNSEAKRVLCLAALPTA